MYLRFAVHATDEDSRRETGLFTVLYRLRDTGHLSADETTWFDEQERWFRRHLKRPKDLKEPLAIMWFKATAAEHIARMRALAALLEHKDTLVAVFETEKPGYLVYEDDHQVAAIPFARETFRGS
jgi:hypothetical protein